MSVSSGYGSAGVSSLYNQQAQAMLRRAANVSTAAEEKRQFLLQEEPPAGCDSESLSAENKSTAGQQAPVDYENMRGFFSRALPPIVTRLTTTGDFGPPGVDLPMRQEYQSLVVKYYQEVKEEFGINENYLPHVHQLPEYDPQIDVAMEQALTDKLAADPTAMSCIQGLNVTFPPPKASEFNIFETPAYQYALDTTKYNGGSSLGSYQDNPNARIWHI